MDLRMESLGGHMPPGKPVSVTSAGRSHVFAIAAGGGLNHWVAGDGGRWSGPSPLPSGNLVASVPCAIALPDGSLHVFAIDNGARLASWNSANGDTWEHNIDPSIPIPGGWNGLAVASADGKRRDVFATTQSGIIHFVYDGQHYFGLSVLPGSAGLPVRLLEAVSAAPGHLDVFVTDPNLRVPARWHFNGSWGPKQTIVGDLHPNSGLAAVVTGLGRIALFGITQDNKMRSWAIQGAASTVRILPVAGVAIPEGIPAAAADGNTIDLVAIGEGGKLVHWRFNAGSWEDPVNVYDGYLATGGLTSIRSPNRLEAFGFQADGTLVRWCRGWFGWRQVDSEMIVADPAAACSNGLLHAVTYQADRLLHGLSWSGPARKSPLRSWVIDGEVFSGAAAAVAQASPSAAQPSMGLEVFARRSDNAIWANSIENFNGSHNTWFGWRGVAANPVSSNPAAISRQHNQIDLFARGTDDRIYWNHSGNLSSSNWSGWLPLADGKFSSAPTVASWDPERLDVFARGLDNALWTNSLINNTWTGWHRVAPNPIHSNPAAVAWRLRTEWPVAPTGAIEVVAVGTDDQMYSISFDGSKWGGWVPLGGLFIGGPAVTRWLFSDKYAYVTSNDLITVFARGLDHTLWSNSRQTIDLS